MSVKAMSWAFEQAIPPGPKIVLLSVADQTWDQRGYWVINWADLERMCSLSRRTIRRYLAQLEENGLVTLSQRWDEGSGMQLTNLCTLQLDRAIHTTTCWGEGTNDGHPPLSGEGTNDGQGGCLLRPPRVAADGHPLIPNLNLSSSSTVSDPFKNPCRGADARPAELVVRAPPKSVEVWEAYSGAYVRRYGIEPVRNRKTNALLCQLVDRLGVADAPRVAAWYVQNMKPLYASNRHPVTLLLRDAEGLRTECMTGRTDAAVPRSVAEQL